MKVEEPDDTLRAGHDASAPRDRLRVALVRKLDSSALLAALAVLIGWFLMHTLVTDLGSVRLAFRFYNMLTLIENPARIVTGIGSGHAGEAFLFGIVCLAVAIAALAPYVTRQRVAWLALLAPCALMIGCGLWLYVKSSADAIPDTGRIGELGSQVVQLANTLTNRLGGMAERRVSLGMGAYLSFIASSLLAVRGVVRFRAETRTRTR